MKKYISFLPAFLILLILFSALPLLSTQASQTKYATTFYFYWYDIYSNLHILNPDGTDALTDHPPDQFLNNFSFTEVDWHQRELLDMIDAQIDIVLAVYWGDDGSHFWSQAGLLNLVIAMNQLISEGKNPPKIGMSLDTMALQAQNDGIRPDVTTKKGKAMFYKFMYDFYSIVPNELWAHIDGRPVIYLYASLFVSKYNKSTFQYLSNRFKRDFGVKPYIVREGSWQGVKTDAKYFWGAANMGPKVTGFVGNVGPGFDDAAVAKYHKTRRRLRKRECGDFYSYGWEEMINAGLNLISIETWNELHEGTDIADSREYNKDYISLTKKYINKWKSTSYADTSLVWMDFSEYSYLKGMRPASNQGDGSWSIKSIKKRDAAFPDIKRNPLSCYIYLDVSNEFIHAGNQDVWVTVEYYDGGNDQWGLEYDSRKGRFASTPMVRLQNTRKWKRQVFHLKKAYFENRQNDIGDFRLYDNSNNDQNTNYFGRIWVSKSPPTNQAPNLLGKKSVKTAPGKATTIPLSISDPDNDSFSLRLENDLDFVSIEEKANGKYEVKIKPEKKDSRSTPYRLIIVATDKGSPPLSDTLVISVKVK